MDSYEQGFLTKCAELGVDGRLALGILKLAFDPGLQQAEEEYRKQYGTEPPNDWYVQRALANGRQSWKKRDEKLSKVQPAMSNVAQQGQQMVQQGQQIVQRNNAQIPMQQPSQQSGGTCPTCGQSMPMSKAAYDSILKRAEPSDPNLQRASEIFKDWLTTKKHTVRSGEVLSGIARKYNVSMDEIMKENNMASILGIKPGQQLRIPVQQNKEKA